MAAFDFSPFAVGGATRPDSFSGLDPDFQAALAQMFQAAPPEVQPHLRITSGFRSPQRQAELWQGALAKYGSPDAARKWVAPPGNSKHNHGQAVDLKYLDPIATKWAHENAAKFGLAFPLANENWHIEPIGARGGHQHQGPAGAAPAGNPVDPASQGGPAAVASEGQGGLAQLFANLAPEPVRQPKMLGGVSQMVDQASFGTGDPVGASMAAMEGVQNAQGLTQSMLPDIEALMALSRRKPVGLA